jgi:oligopeptide transport system ATP-binding protein
MSLLVVQNLKVYFPVNQGGWGGSSEQVKAVNDVSFTIEPGTTAGLVGESGCGKSTLGRAIVRLIEPTAGNIYFAGENITRMPGAALRTRRRHFQMIFQDPYGSLDPRFRVEQVLGEALEIHKLARGPSEKKGRVEELLGAVGLKSSDAVKYPHEFSGGQRQRIGIARALAVDPKLIVCDEPVSSLDVSVQAQVINLLQELQAKRGVAYLFIAHDLAVVEHISHQILVMYLGRIVEAAPGRQLCRHPQHPYTKALLAAVPVVGGPPRERLRARGELPSPVSPPSGCPFHPRCPVAEARCKVELPGLKQTVEGHWVACHLAGENQVS